MKNNNVIFILIFLLLLPFYTNYGKAKKISPKLSGANILDETNFKIEKIRRVNFSSSGFYSSLKMKGRMNMRFLYSEE